MLYYLLFLKLFTMCKNRILILETRNRNREILGSCFQSQLPATQFLRSMVDPSGIEPLTS